MYVRPVAHTYAEATLATGADAAFTVPVGCIGCEITLDDSAIGFTVQVPGITARIAVAAGASYLFPLGGRPLSVAVALQVRSASGTPVAVAEYATEV